MKDVRPQFTEEEYLALRAEADRLGVSLKRLVRDRAMGIVTEDAPLCSARVLCAEMTACREVLNQIIKRETEADVRLYEDDVIRIEAKMCELEDIVTTFAGKMIRQVKRNGNTAV